MTRHLVALVASISIASSAWAVDASLFMGTWVSVPEATKQVGSIRTYVKTASGYDTVQNGVRTSFVIDGQDHPTANGQTMAWSQVDANTWDTVWKADGKVFTRSHRTLSPDGKVLTSTSVDVGANGEETTSTVVLDRLSAGSGLEGRWRVSKVEYPPQRTTMSEPRPGVLRMETPSQQEISEGPLDFTPFAMTSPGFPPNWVGRWTLTDARTLKWTGGYEGKVMVRGVSTISKDGKTQTSRYRYVTNPSREMVEVSRRE